MPVGSPGAFPMPSAGGPQYAKFHMFEPAYSEVTDKHVYEDGGASFQTFNSSAPIRIVIEYDGYTLTELATLKAHRADAFGEVYGFSIAIPASWGGGTLTDVHYDESFEEDHAKTWEQRRVIHLIKRPV